MWPFKSEPAAPAIEPELSDYVKQAPSSAESRPQRPMPKREVATTGKSTHQVAMDNCVEYEQAFSNCLKSGSYIDRVGSCQQQKHMHDMCVQLQTQALTVLGYPQADPAHKKAIKARADDLMIETCPSLQISEQHEQTFHDRLDALAES